MDRIEQEFSIRFRYDLYMTKQAFSPENPLLRDIIASDLENGPKKVLFAVDRGLCEAHPGLLRAITDYCRTHADTLKLVCPPLLVAGGEAAKNQPEHVRNIQSAIHEHGLCRHAYVVALGGGAMIDAVGFAAATAHRGIRLIRMPSTVLAQCDAAVGVKNGVNAFGKKNFLGTFTPPYAVINDATFLKTLSMRDWRAGLAEAVKVALLKDPAFFAALEQEAGALVRRDLSTMQAMIRRCAQLHLAHIASSGDPFELGSSRPLDFGHWAAHKLEQLTNFELRHGEAVAIGLALDSTYALLDGHLPQASWRRILNLLEALGFALHVPQLDQGLDAPDAYHSILRGLEEFREHLGGELNITLLREIGRPFEVHAMDRRLLKEAVAILATRTGAAAGPANNPAEATHIKGEPCVSARTAT